MTPRHVFQVLVAELGFRSKRSDSEEGLLTPTPQYLGSRVVELCNGIDVASSMPHGASSLGFSGGWQRLPRLTLGLPPHPSQAGDTNQEGDEDFPLCLL